MNKESNLWLLVESPFTTLPNEKLKLDSHSCMKKSELWAAVGTLSSFFLELYQSDLQPSTGLQTELTEQGSYPRLVVQSTCEAFLSWGPHKGLNSIPLHKTWLTSSRLGCLLIGNDKCNMTICFCTIPTHYFRNRHTECKKSVLTCTLECKWHH